MTGRQLTLSKDDAILRSSAEETPKPPRDEGKERGGSRRRGEGDEQFFTSSQLLLSFLAVELKKRGRDALILKKMSLI